MYLPPVGDHSPAQQPSGIESTTSPNQNLLRRDPNDFSQLRLQALKRVFDQFDVDRTGNLDIHKTKMGMLSSM